MNEGGFVKMKQQNNLVWYASFGSNLFKNRFLCYITGGQPEGSNRREVGSRDHTLPKDNRAVSLPFALYFSGYSDRWDGAGAFIDTVRDETNSSWARMYLITEEQFEDVVRQENGVPDMEVDVDHIKEKGSVVIQDSPYGNLIYAGEAVGYPIFTFTHQKPMSEQEINIPSKRYLAMLIRGYLETYTDDATQIASYLAEKPGVKGVYSYEDLLEFTKEQQGV